jgi:hypothetical protein
MGQVRATCLLLIWYGFSFPFGVLPLFSFHGFTQGFTYVSYGFLGRRRVYVP